MTTTLDRSPFAPSAFAPSAGNDVRGVLLVHDRLRAAVPAVAGDLRALRPGDRRGARDLRRRWARLGDALRWQLAVEAAVLWPVVLATAPELAGEVRRRVDEHAALEADVVAVEAGLERFGAPVPAPADLAAVAARLDIHLRRHLAAVEQLALPVLRHRVGPEGWPPLAAALGGGDPDRRAGARPPVRVSHRAGFTRSARAPGR